MPASARGFLAFAPEALKAAGISLRLALPEDVPVLTEIYASTREEELRQVPWSAEQKKAFTDWQSARQEEHYALHYPNAERLLIRRLPSAAVEGEGQAAIGRIYVETTRLEVRLMDITLLRACRSLGIGTRLMNELLRFADALQRPVTLHVEPFNPAKRMYERMGFEVSETRGLYEFMIRATPDVGQGVS